MTTYSAPGALVRRAWAINKPLTTVGLSMAVVLVAAVIGLVLDDDVITGAPAWLKPAKFAISVAVYSFTFLWLLTFITGHSRQVRRAARATAVAFAVEVAFIAGAAILDTTSHFNVSSPVHVVIWVIMAIAIVCAWVANLAVGVLLLRQRLADRALAWSLRLGVFISTAGMAEAFLMTQPTADQLSVKKAGGGMPIIGQHSVDIHDGGPGLPVVGWSTVGGDLRVAHFIGLHGLQALPLFGLLLSRFGPAWLRPGDRVGLVWTAGLAYFGIFVLAAGQALRGEPVNHPNARTLIELTVIVAASLVAVAVIAIRAIAARTTGHTGDPRARATPGAGVGAGDTLVDDRSEAPEAEVVTA